MSSKLADKIRKLMAKANDASVTEAEAAAFAAKVQELLLQSGLSMADVGSSGEEPASVGESQFDFQRWNSTHRRGLLGAVCQFYMCEVLYWQRLKMLKILGKPQNVEIAVQITDYLINTVIRISNEYGRANPGSNVIDFRRGAMLRLRERLVEEKRRMEAQAKSSNPGNLPVLFVNEGALVKAYIEGTYKVKQSKARRIKHGRDAYAGRKAADAISLQQRKELGK